MFAIITFRHSGPIKSWAAMQAANVHNARTKPLDHAMPGAPGPRHLIGTGDLVADVKRGLDRAKIDPVRIRKNGVIAYEAILSASSAFFDQGTAIEQRERLDAWTGAQVLWARQRYGAHRIASMVLHVDEKTPHVHLVVLPLEVKSDRRRADNEVRWSLVGRMISGPGRFDEVQDDYAAAMAPFGLVRGVKGSGRKHEPVPVYLARMAAKERDVDAARALVALEVTSIAADRARNAETETMIQAGFASLGAAVGKLKVDQAALDAETVGLQQAWLNHAGVVAQHGRNEYDRRQALDRDRSTMSAAIADERRKLDAERTKLEREKADHAALVVENNRRLAADRAIIRQHQIMNDDARAQLAKDIDVQRGEAKATTRAMEAAVQLQTEAEADRAVAAVDRVRAKTMAGKIDAHRAQLLPTLRAAADFRKNVETLKGRPLTPAASATLAAVEVLRREATTLVAPASETRPDMLAAYAMIRERGARLGR